MFNKVNEYYWQHLSELPIEKQLHYAARLWLWSGKTDERARERLDHLQTHIIGDSTPASITASLQDAAQATPQYGASHAGARREPYFARYPLLQPASRAFFKALYMQSCYGIDAREHVLAQFPLKSLEQTAQELMQDPDAVRALSTHAVNFVYLLERFIKQSSAPLARTFHEVCSGFRSDDPEDVLLHIYLLTHCVIGESQFYNQPIRIDLESYQQMCRELDALITQQYDNVSLDNKFETLVCHELTGTAPNLRERILEEASNSFSDEGDFVIDTHNNTKAKGLTNFSQSEHRNVLLVMATMPKS